MKRPTSIAGRLILALTIGTTVLWLLAAAGSSAVLQYELGESFDRAQIQTAQRLLPLAIDSVSDSDTGSDQAEPRLFIQDRDDALSYQLRRSDGTIVLRSDDAPAAPYGPDLKAGFADTTMFRIFTLGDPKGQFSIQVAELLAHRQRAIVGSVLTLFLPLLLLIPASALLISIAVRRGMAPLGALRQEIAQRGGGNLAPLTIDTMPAEIAPIAAALNALLERLRAALEAERQFAANSAHELRTPIAGALAQTQRLIETSPDERARQEGRKIEATLRRLGDLAEKLMQLARADAGIAAVGAMTTVLPILELTIGDARARGRPPRSITLDAAPGAEAIEARINLDALGIVLRNLVDNALVHGLPGTPVAVTMAADGAITIRNDGPVIPPETLARVGRRFERGPTSASGSGLGLAIVETIVAQVGGSLSLASPIPGQADGFEAVVRFSSAGPAP